MSMRPTREFIPPRRETKRATSFSEENPPLFGLAPDGVCPARVLPLSSEGETSFQKPTGGLLPRLFTLTEHSISSSAGGLPLNGVKGLPLSGRAGLLQGILKLSARRYRFCDTFHPGLLWQPGSRIHSGHPALWSSDFPPPIDRERSPDLF